jgi:transposase, IS30 family
MSYHRLNANEREEISRMLVQGCSLREIGRSLQRNVSTISNEVRAGGCNRYLYRATRAQKRAKRNARKRKLWKRKVLLRSRLRHYIHAKLRLRWSPEEIAHKIVEAYPDDMTMRISPEAIYSYIYVLPRGALKKELLACLRRERKRRHKRRRVGMPVIERKIADMLSIEERPAEVADRTIPGHWEGDLLIGKNRQSALGSLVERTTRTTILIPLKNRTAEEVRKKFAKEAKKLPMHMRLSMTYDQGREMSEHKLFTKDTHMLVYFAHPAAPWERGTNENTNGLVRQFFPKGTDFSKISRRAVKRVQHLLNGRPRKVLNWATPYEVFNTLLR